MLQVSFWELEACEQTTAFGSARKTPRLARLS
jgi:hypothetical protein